MFELRTWTLGLQELNAALRYPVSFWRFFYIFLLLNKIAPVNKYIITTFCMININNNKNFLVFRFELRDLVDSSFVVRPFNGTWFSGIL